jgi:hypothetical protein
MIDREAIVADADRIHCPGQLRGIEPPKPGARAPRRLRFAVELLPSAAATSFAQKPREPAHD